jgi:hypothetical protein
LSGVTRRSPIRLATATIATVIALSGCATFDNTDTVATVADVTIETAQLESYLTEFTDRSELFQSTPLDHGRASGTDARIMVGALVRQQLFRSFVEENGLDVAELRRSFIDSTIATSPASDVSDELQVLIADIEPQVQSAALATAAVPNVDELRALYAEDPAATGLVCVRHILLETEDEALAVLTELDGGADFATLATERSKDPSAATGGGAISDGSSECIPLQTMLQGFDPGFVAGALAAGEGVPSQPVESSFGWHVIVHRPWSEIGETVGAMHQPGDSGNLLFEGYRVTTEVEVDPRYGIWDPVAGGVLPAG